MLRVGTVPFLVARPLDLGLEEEPGVELVRDVPARLVEGLREGALDVALVSSVELFRRPGYRWVDGLAVAGRGPVASVQVFLRSTLAQARSVALDPASRAAAALVQVVWPGAYRPAFRELPAGADPRDAEADAWLRIGDAALRERLAPDAPATFDPCAAWTATTGLPFAFAVWVVRPGASLSDAHLAALARALARGAEALPRLADEAAAAWELPPEATRRYLTDEVVYEPGEELAPALRAFRDRAGALGLCRPELEPEPIDPRRAARA